MRLIRRLIELAFVILVISLFMKNKDVTLQIDYYGLKEPIRIAFWELVTFCVSIGIIIAALGDFITQLKWIGERRRMIKRDQHHQSEVDGLNAKINQFQEETKRLKKEAETQSREIETLRLQLASQAVKPSALTEPKGPLTQS
jgi:Tfp pilus assembly protein PilN